MNELQVTRQSVVNGPNFNVSYQTLYKMKQLYGFMMFWLLKVSPLQFAGFDQFLLKCCYFFLLFKQVNLI